MKPIFFEDQFEFRRWFEANHEKEKEVIVGYYKIKTTKPSITWSESVDQALCFGWIDGIRRKIDEESYCIRFTPRNPKSTWSAINIQKVKILTQKGLMHENGLKVYNLRKLDNSEIYSYENKPVNLPIEFETRIKENKESWKFFSSQSDSYKKTIYYWIMSAKQDKTKLSRLEKLIDSNIQRKRIN